MSYNVRLSLFLLGAMIVAALGYFSAFFELWMQELLIIVTIVLAIEIGWMVLKRDRL